MNGWRERAACRGLPLALFELRDGESARKVCASCPVIGECQAAVLASDPVKPGDVPDVLRAGLTGAQWRQVFFGSERWRRG